jgi:hypothetical protein
LKNGDVFKWTSKTPKQRLTQTGSIIEFMISTDGKRILLKRLVNKRYIELWIKNLETNNEFILLSIQDFADLAFDSQAPNAISFIPHTVQWIPDTHVIAFNIQQILDGPGTIIMNDLRWANADTKEFGTLLFPGYGGEFSYAPDGTKIALSTATSISLVNADGTGWRVLHNFDQINSYSDYKYYPKMHWDETSKYFLTIIPPKDALASNTLLSNIWSFSTNADTPKLVDSFSAVPFFVEEAKFSPNLDLLAYLTLTGEATENLNELHILEINQRNNTNYITAPLLHFTSWATDSMHFTYYTSETDETWLGNRNNSPQPLMPDSIGIHNIFWVDNSRFFFLQEELV